ncbi:MAG: hypothetical protein RLZZ157_424, partial [Pseudomonadota bacterium]
MTDPASSIFADLEAVEAREVPDANALDTLLKSASQPFVVRGLVSHWPLVKAGLLSPRAARAYLLERARDVPFSVSIGPPGHDGRMFYDANMGMNFQTARGKLSDIFGSI